MLELQENEAIQWRGAPLRHNLTAGATAKYIGIGVIILAVIATTHCADTLHLEQFVPDAVLDLLRSEIASIVLPVSAIVVFCIPVLIKQMLAHTRYVITNQRCVVISNTPWNKNTQTIDSYWYGDIQNVKEHTVYHHLVNITLSYFNTANNRNTSATLYYLPAEAAAIIQHAVRNPS